MNKITEKLFFFSKKTVIYSKTIYLFDIIIMNIVVRVRGCVWQKIKK